MPDLQLCAIYRYPVKSLQGRPLKTAHIEARGVRQDRRWMVVDDTGHFLTQRAYPKMASLVVQFIEGDLVIQASDRDILRIPQTLTNGPRIVVQVWKNAVEALSAGSEAGAWFSRHLGITCQLVYMPDESIRPVDPQYAPNGHPVSFADGYPVLLTTEASLGDLNGRLTTPLPMNRFRPNLVVQGCEAFEEDLWRLIRIGDVTFRVAKPCDRCSVTTVDQEAGIVTGKEPLKTLATYRQFAGQVYFGQNLIPENEGMVRVGDTIEILEAFG